MTFSQALAIERGVSAVIGGGGKTALLQVLAQELRAQGTVVLCTTTRILPFPDCPTLRSPSASAVDKAVGTHGVICVGTAAEGGKLAASELTMEQLCQLADYVLVEADGSKYLPLKAHAPHEPVIPLQANQTICVVGLSGLGKPIREVAHRSGRYADLAQATEDTVVTPALAARVLNAEGLATRYFLNQADSAREQALARELGRQLRAPVVIGSLQKGILLC